MRNYIDLEAIVRVALGLQELREKMVFIGGAVLGFYADDSPMAELRPTRDVDLTIELAGFSDWVRLQERLAELGFLPDASEQVICRYLFEQITVDIMPASDSPLGISNPWYLPAFPFVFKQIVMPGVYIQLFPVEYMLATKFAAFEGRGKDYRTSHDFEDIVFIINNYKDLTAKIRTANTDVRNYLQSKFRLIWHHPHREEILSCHLSPFEAGVQMPVILGKIERIAAY
jgi:Nucleotidyl transferase AbiEii toxin, Type IV TA system